MKILQEEIRRLSTIEDLSSLLPSAESRAADIHTSIDALKLQIERCQTRLGRANDAYVDGVLDALEHKRQIGRIKGETADLERQIEAQERLLQAEEHRDSQLARLHEVVNLGPAMLTEPDIALANAWFRTHVKIWVENTKIVETEWL